MKIMQTIRRFSAITIAAALGVLTLIPADAAAQEVTVMRHTTQPLPGYGTLSLEIWNDGAVVQVIGLDAEDRIVLAREGTMSEEPTLEGTGAVEGMLPAGQLSFDTDGTLEHERCETPSCARGIATMAESIVRAATMGAVEGADESTTMANLCPTTGADDAQAHAPTEGEPVLAGVDLDSGYLFGLSLSATRDGEAWAELLREGQCQGLELSVVVKDAAKGIAAGVSEVFPHAEQRDDCFHVLYEMNKVRRRLERRAYAAIEREGEALGRLGSTRSSPPTTMRTARSVVFEIPTTWSSAETATPTRRSGSSRSISSTTVKQGVLMTRSRIAHAWRGTGADDASAAERGCARAPQAGRARAGGARICRRRARRSTRQARARRAGAPR